MWIKIGELVINPRLFWEGEYCFSMDSGKDERGRWWYVFKRQPDYETVFESRGDWDAAWLDLDKIKDIMPLTYAALMDCEPTKEQYMKAKEYVQQGVSDGSE